MQNQQAIFESIFKRDLSDPGNAAFLENITAAHPYFSPAQFFLLQQTAADSEAFNKQAAKTALFFNNPYWLNFQLHYTNEIFLPKEEPAEESVPAVEEIKIIEEPLQSPAIETTIPDEPVLPIVEEIKTVEELTHSPAIEAITTEAPVQPAPEKTEPKPIQEKNIMDEMPLFEPMHMVDYFASQGIKLSEEAQTADKLGKQLKSFTEWLKTMKKVHVETGLVSGQVDISIQSLAEKSNTEDEVLTEAMADVLAKQGKIDKAREVLEKLSLLNPPKSAYFAAKIESLNKS